MQTIEHLLAQRAADALSRPIADLFAQPDEQGAQNKTEQQQQH